MILTQACAGRLWDFQDDDPADALAFLAAHTDGRYGGHCRARWDGRNLWAPEMGEDERAEYKRLLVPMLAACAGRPAGAPGLVDLPCRTIPLTTAGARSRRRSCWPFRSGQLAS